MTVKVRSGAPLELDWHVHRAQARRKRTGHPILPNPLLQEQVVRRGSEGPSTTRLVERFDAAPTAAMVQPFFFLERRVGGMVMHAMRMINRNERDTKKETHVTVELERRRHQVTC